MDSPFKKQSKWTPEIWDKILGALRLGNTRSAAVGYAGVTQRTFYVWMERSEELRDQVMQAEAHAEVRVVTRLQKSIIDGSVQAQLEWLKRRRRKDWGDHMGMDMSVTIANPAAALQKKLEALASQKELEAGELAELEAGVAAEAEQELEGINETAF